MKVLCMLYARFIKRIIIHLPSSNSNFHFEHPSLVSRRIVQTTRGVEPANAEQSRVRIDQTGHSVRHLAADQPAAKQNRSRARSN